MTNAKPVELQVVRWQRKSTPTWGWIEVHEDDLDFYKAKGAEIRGLALHSEAAALISQLTAERDALTADLECMFGMEESTAVGSERLPLVRQCRGRAEAAENRVKELEEGRDLDKVVLDEGIEIINELESSNKLLSERVAVLEKALEPFSKAAGGRQVMCDDTERVTWSAITVGDLRRARTALEGK